MKTADQGVAPNPAQPEVFLAVAVDTYDEENGIHPRYKQVVAERLAVAGLNVAYGMVNCHRAADLIFTNLVTD